MTGRLLKYLYLLLCVATAGAGTACAQPVYTRVPPLPADTSLVNRLNKTAVELIQDGQYDSAIVYVQQALEMAQFLDYSKGIAGSYNSMGRIARNKGWIKKSAFYYHEGLRISLQTGDRVMASKFYHNLARVYDNLGNYPQAMELLLLSLGLKLELNDKNGIANTVSHIGDIYSLQHNPRAARCYAVSLQLYRELGDSLGTAMLLNDIGLMYMELRQYPKARKNFESALVAGQIQPNATEQANSYCQLGRIQHLCGAADSAAAFFQRSLELYSQVNNLEGITTAEQYWGDLLLGQHDRTGALRHYQLSLAAAEQSGIYAKQQEAHQKLSDLYMLMGDASQAFFHYRKFTEAREKIHNDENARRLMKTEMNFEFQAREQALRYEQIHREAMHQADLRQQRTRSIALLLLLILVIVLAYFLLQRIRARQKLRVAELQNKIASDLHDDVGSALSSINIYSGMAAMPSEEESLRDILREIGRTSRETIANMNDIVWSIQPQHEQFQHILHRMENFGRSILGATGTQFEFTAGEELQKITLGPLQRRNLFLVYKEAVNNAAKYAQAGKVAVQLYRRRQRLHLVIRDDGTGFDPERVVEGNGLQNLRKRALELGGTVDIRSAPGKGTEIALEFRISQH